jgi:hypothetical protein
METAKPKGKGEEKVSFSRSVEAKCSLDSAWNEISDIDNEPKYYEGLNSVKTISRKGNVIEREVVGGFLKHNGRQVVTLFPKESVEVKMTKGPMIGTRITNLYRIDNVTTKIQVTWDVELRVPRFVQSVVKSELVKGTEEALERLAKESEMAEGKGQAS